MYGYNSFDYLATQKINIIKQGYLFQLNGRIEK